MTLKYLIQKEFLQIRRNTFLPRLIFLFPIVIMCVMPWVMSMEVRNIVVDVVDNDRTMSSQQLVHDIEASNYFIFHGQQPTYQAALADIETGKADVVLVIPQDYSRDLTMGRQPQVLIAANAVNGTKGSMGSAYLSQIVTAHALPEAATIQSKVSTLLLYNKHQNYKVFMIPALFAIVMMLMTGFLPTLNIVGEKEAGTIEQINVTPVSKWAFILSKLIPYWIIALRHHQQRSHLARLCAGYVAGAVLLVVRPHRFELFRHHAAGGLCHVVLRGLSHAAQRPLHADALHAALGLSDHLRQPDALLHRRHPHRLHPRRHLPGSRPSDPCPALHRPRHGLLGGAELQEEQLT